jgi:hypothetical protein
MWATALAFAWRSKHSTCQSSSRSIAVPLQCCAHWCSVTTCIARTLIALAARNTFDGLSVTLLIVLPYLQLPPQELVASKLELAELKEQQVCMQRQLFKAQEGLRNNQA